MVVKKWWRRCSVRAALGHREKRWRVWLSLCIGTEGEAAAGD
jgi:hypothetical protein